MFLNGAPIGLHPSRTGVAAAFSGGGERYSIPDGANIADFHKNTPVTLTGDATPAGVPIVDVAGPGDPLVGSVHDRDYIADRDNGKYASGDKAFLLVQDNPNVHFTIATDTEIDVNDAGQFCDLTAQSGNATFNISNVMLDAATVGSGTQVQLLRLVQAPYHSLTNCTNTAVQQYWEVRIVDHQRAHNAAQV